MNEIKINVKREIIKMKLSLWRNIYLEQSFNNYVKKDSGVKHFMHRSGLFSLVKRDYQEELNKFLEYQLAKSLKYNMKTDLRIKILRNEVEGLVKEGKRNA